MNANRASAPIPATMRIPWPALCLSLLMFAVTALSIVTVGFARELFSPRSADSVNPAEQSAPALRQAVPAPTQLVPVAFPAISQNIRASKLQIAFSDPGRTAHSPLQSAVALPGNEIGFFAGTRLTSFRASRPPG